MSWAWLLLLAPMLLVPGCKGGQVYFADTQVVTQEGTQFSLKIGHTGDINGIVNVIVSVDNLNQDFIGSSQVASFAPGGSTIASVTFTVADDQEPEVEETYHFRLSVIGTETTVTVPNIATVIIQANDDAYGVFSIIDSSPLLTREDPVSTNIVNINVGRTQGQNGQVTVNYRVESGDLSAVVGEDITPAVGSVTFNNGEEVNTIQLQIRTDTIPENDESFYLILTSATQGARVVNTNFTIIILGNDAPVRFQQQEFRFDENPITRIMSLTVLRGYDTDGVTEIGSVDAIATVNYMLLPNTAQSSQDYRGPNGQSSGQLVFGVGSRSATINVEIIDDGEPEVEEYFQAVLSSPSGDVVVVQPDRIKAIINANDNPAGIVSLRSPDLVSLPYAQLNEDTDVDAVFTVVRTAGTFGMVSVNWEIIRNDSGSGNVSLDLTPVSGTVTFGSGEREKTIVVSIQPDTISEPAERFKLRLLPSSAVGGVEVEGITDGIIVVEDSDNFYGMVQFADDARQALVINADPRMLQLVITRTGENIGDLHLNLSVAYQPSDGGSIDVLEDTDVATVMFSGQSEVIEHIHLLPGAFVQVGGVFTADLLGVTLVTVPLLGPFNSPYVGTRASVSITVTPAEANGEIGFRSLETLHVTEPTSSPLEVRLPLSREGTSGDATISWTLVGSGTQASLVTQQDVANMQGTILMASGLSETHIVLSILPDDVPELDEEMTLTLTSVQPAGTQRLKPGATQRRIVIDQNDNPGGVFQFDPSEQLSFTLTEGASPKQFTVIRDAGDLLQQSIQYIIVGGEADFYGYTNVLTFASGEKVKQFSVAAIPDGIPELEEVFSLEIRSYGSSPAVIGARSSVELRVTKNDAPHGVLQFPLQVVSLAESKSGISEVATVAVKRTQGMFGAVQLSWSLDISTEQDLRPAAGFVTFNSDQDLAFITLESVPDEITEGVESFQLTLSEPQGGAVIGANSSCTIVIVANDYNIMFDSTFFIVEEPSETTVLLCREGPGDAAVTLHYQTVDGTANSVAGDYSRITAGSVMFDVGEMQQSIVVRVLDDTVPEGREVFYLEVYSIEGDVVFNGASQVNFTILDNDMAYGVFKFNAPFSQDVEEGSTVQYAVTRDGGTFGGVEVFYELYNTATNEKARDGGDFVTIEHLSVRLEVGERTKYIPLSPRIDNQPETEKTYTIVLTSLSVFEGRDDMTMARISDFDNTAMLTILASDDPNGKFGFPLEYQAMSVAEDFYPGHEGSTHARLLVERRMGIYGSVEVMWEIYSDQVAGGLPYGYDLIFLGTIPSTFMLVPDRRRPGTGTHVVSFPGDSAAFISLPVEHHPPHADISNGFSISAWVQALANTDGYILAKTNGDGSRHFYSLRLLTNSLQTQLVFGYSVTGSNQNEFLSISVQRNIEDTLWHHLVVSHEAGQVRFYVDGTFIGARAIATSQVLIDFRGRLTVGAKYPGSQQFSGYMQDVRVYIRPLTDDEISELHTMPARLDLEQVSGYISYPVAVREGYVDVSSRPDVEEEGDETFTVRLINAKYGATLSAVDYTATITVLKSDNANGLFLFREMCQPAAPETEATIVTCSVERDRGDEGQVIVTWAVYQRIGSQVTLATEDFTEYTGQVVFEAGDLQKTFSVQLKDDNIPESQETYEIHLTEVTTEDGVAGSTNVSGASISPDHRVSVVTMKKNDYLHGLLQFKADGIPPLPGDPFIEPIQERPTVRVSEEAGIVRLLVVRAMGYQGEITVEWRTTDGSAKSSGKTPPDYRAAVGRISMRDGERYAFIDINIVDNDIPEDEKSFVVTLLNPSGGAVPGVGSVVTVVIEHSDGAFGVFQFDPAYLGVQATEDGDSGYNTVILKISRTEGSIGSSLVSWEIVINNNDLVDHHGNVTFTHGQLSGDLEIKVRGDTVSELDELFVVQITAVSRGELGAFSQLRSEVTILANDDPYGMFVFPTTQRPVFVDEINQLITMEIHREGGSYGSVEVNYTTLTPTQTYPFLPNAIPRADLSDYQMTSGTVLFTQGQEVATFDLQILDDLDPEEDEAIFVMVTGVKLVDAAQIRPVVGSPRLGSDTESYGQVIINYNDNANGELVLSPLSPEVREGQTEDFLFVTRYGGAFGEVTVTFNVVDGTALSGIDFTVMSQQVTLLRGETSSAVPIRVIDDSLPEMSETFSVQLDQVSGGGVLGSVTSATVIIAASDDPNGAFEFSMSGISVEEPEGGPTTVNLTVLRTGGTLGVITLDWFSMLDGSVPLNDITPTSGSIFFVSNEANQHITISVLPDDIPEGQEDIEISLTTVTDGGRIGERSVFTLSILSNDNPHGVVELAQTQYNMEERDTNTQQAILVKRSGGSYGQLRVYYSTGRVQYIEEDISGIGPSVLDYFYDPLAGGRGTQGEAIDVMEVASPTQTCGEACLMRISCKAFEVLTFNVTYRSCTLFDTTTSDPLPIQSSSIQYYEKDFVKAGELMGVHATPGEDFVVVTNGYILIDEGVTEATLPITILADSVPELDEKFLVQLTRVDVMGEAPSPNNSPYLGELLNATVTILANDDTYGAFTVKSDSPLATDGGHSIAVEERQNLAVELVVERTGGTLGHVSVDWAVDIAASTATYGVDFRADGATLAFIPGESRKLISVTILDDTMPELSKTIVVRLSRPHGGATISRDNATITVLENDHVAGVLSLSTTSILAKEGDTVTVQVLRNPSQYGTVTVDWNILGHNDLDPSQGFQNYHGTLTFNPGESEKSLVLDVLADNIPEVNEEYELHLLNPQTTGIGISGAASLDPLLRSASITIEGSNNPHGVVQFSSNSLNVRVNEATPSVRVQLDRKFGAIGVVRVDYEITGGSVSLTNDELVYASANNDFVAERKFVDFADGVSSASITVTILEDEIPEVDEVFIVRLLSVSLVHQQTTADPPVLGSSGTVSQVIINANDGTKGVAVFAQDSHNVLVDETSGNITLTIQRNLGTFGDVSVFYYAQSVVEGTNLGLDYKIQPEELVFMNGQVSRQIQIEIVNDDLPEPDETFEIILSNPKNGLVLGNPSRAMVTILANDDSAGFIYLESIDLVTLEEPSSDGSALSTVNVVVMRGPGMYGVVNVPYEIVPELEANRQDLSPMQGTLTLQNKQTSVTIQLTVLDDDIPEEVERFTLRLLPPDGSAKLGAKTQRTIIINPNDSPHGLFSMYAAGTRLREISVEEGDGMVQFDIVRTQGLDGTVTVDMATEPGSAMTTADVNSVQLVPIQTLRTTYVEGWYGFSVNGTTYLLMFKPSVVRELTSELGTDGAIGAVDMATLMFTTLFRWQGELIPVQTVETDGVSSAVTFVMGDVHYLVITNKGNHDRYNTQSRLYRINSAGTLTLNLATEAATDVAYFSHNDLHYLVTSSYQDNAGNTQVDTHVWRWEQGNKQFAKVSSIVTVGASAVEVVEIEDKIFLFVANHYDSVAKTYQVDSKVYKFDSTEQFAQHQSLPTLGAVDIEHVRVRSLDLLIVANNRDNTVSSPQKSDVYRWDVTTQMFVLHERLDTNRVNDVHLFTAFDDTVYAVFANTIGSSVLYAWDIQTNHFTSVWTGRPSLAMVPVTIEQGTGDWNMVAMADKNITTHPTLYQLTKVKDSDYAPRTVTMTMHPDEDLLHASVYVLQDTMPEDTETFYVTLRNPTGGAEIGINNRIAVNILSNDNAHGVIEIAPDSLDLQARELVGRDNTVQVNVLRHQGYFGHVTVKWVATGDHDSTNDIMPLEGIIEFATGQSVATISLTIRDDDVAELQEVTYIQLTQVIESGTSLEGRGALIGTNRTSKVTVLANDSPYGVVRWERSTLTVQEPEGSDATVILYIAREQGLAGDLQVSYITSVDEKVPVKQQAVSGEDFISRHGMVVLQENVTRVPVEIVIKQDLVPEAAEIFVVNITGVVLLGATPGPGAEPSVRLPGNIITVTIAENDNARGIVEFNVTTNIEGRIDTYEEFGMNTTIPLTVSRSVGFFGAVTVTWQAEPREATVLDFSPSSGTLSLADTQQTASIYITIIDDNIPEDMETFDIQLISVTGGALLGPASTVRIAILKNDSPNGLFRFVTSEVIVRESRNPTDPDGEVNLIIERIQGSEGVVNVQWRLNAEAVYDFYEPHTGTLLFSQGEKAKSLSLRTKPDSLLEGEEVFRVSLITADNNADISHTQGDARIRVLPDPGASGTVSILPEHRTVYIGEPGERDPQYNGKTLVVLTRGAGIYGDIAVTWSITPRDTSAFLQVEGTVTIADLQQKAAITLQALDDTIPELRSIYTLQLNSATGGALLSNITRATTADIVFVASDYPHGEFLFDLPESYVTSEDRFSVSFPVIRRYGLNGQVFVTYKTYPGTATEHEDYFPEEGTLTFQHGQNRLFVDIQLKQDDLPEGPESFYLNLTSTRLVEPSNNNYTVIDGLQLDMRPAIGSLHTKEIVIERNDNAEGTLQFAPEAFQFSVVEEDGVASIPLTRSGGNYGRVSALFTTRNGTATEGVDYVTPAGEVTFDDGEREAILEVTIRDDSEMEYAETFTVELTGTKGGAKLGSNTISTVTIVKSDFPNGRFGFKGQLKITIDNPPKKIERSFIVERSRGLLGEQTVYWRIFGPNNPAGALQATNDIAFVSGSQELTSGTLTWADGEGGEKSFSLDIKPFTSWEIEKTFVVRLEKIIANPISVGHGEVSPTTGSVALTISKFGHPNGIVRFDGPAQMAREVEEPEGSGTLTLQFPLLRRQDTGTVGNIEVFWEIRGQTDTADVTPRNGSILIADEERTGDIAVEVLSDDIPELTETYRLVLTKIVGGAEIDTQYNISTFSIRYNNEPHGVFGIIPQYQTMVVNPDDLTRHVRLNFTRYAGTFGSVILTFSLKYDIPQSGILLSQSDGTVTFNEGEVNRIVDVGIEGTGFLEVGTTFSLSLVEVQYLGSGVTESPKFRAGQTEAKVTVPAIAANSKIRFKEFIASIHEETSTCRLTVVREGMYGTLDVAWQSGFPPGQLLDQFTEGSVLPTSGSLTIPHGVPEKNFTVELTSKLNVAELFAIHLPTAPSTTVAGGARLIEGETVVRVEPYGLLRFADNSTHPEVSEMFGKVYLQVIRVFGSEGKVEVHYRAEGVSASEYDFHTLENHAVVMETGQTSGLILVDVVQDNTPEHEELFHVNLTSVEKFPTDTTPSVSPRISYLHGASLVTIKESNDPYGVLNMEPETISVSETYQDVNLTVKRTGGVFGTVRVLVRTVGGGEDWTSQIVPRPGASGNDTITEVLGNRDRFTSAVGGTDYVVLDTVIEFKQGELEKTVAVTILADDMAEPSETVLVYLTQPTGGARIAAGEPDGGKKGFTIITIDQNDLSNGVIGFADDSLSVRAVEDTADPTSTLTLKLARTDAFYGEVEISWLAKVSADSSNNEDVILADQLVNTAGSAICPARQQYCYFNITLINDDVPEEEHSFVVKLVAVKNDAKLNEDSLTATVTVAASDYIRGLIGFTADSKTVVVSNVARSVRLRVDRVKGRQFRVEAGYRSLQMTAQRQQYGVTVYPALEGEDYAASSGILVFESDRQDLQYIDVNLTPFEASSNPYPKQFFINLRNPTNGASLDPDASEAAILIVEQEDVAIWDIVKDKFDARPTDEDILNILVRLDTALQVQDKVTENEISLTEDMLNDILDEGMKRKLPSEVINQLLNLLCKLLTPDKADATRGRYQLTAILERLAYIMVTDAPCPTPQPPSLMSLQCVHAKISAGRWPLGNVQGYLYPAQRQDEFVVPTKIPNVQLNNDNECVDFHFIEYSSEQWFQNTEEKQLLSNKVISFGLKDRPSSYTDYPVTFRIHSPDRRIATRQAQCVYFDMALHMWVSPGDVCTVTNDLDLAQDDFVDCSCKHLTNYAIKAETSDPGIVGYTVWFFVACFICIAGLLAAILAHHLCSISAMFSASLLMHMCFAAMATQICYVVAAYLSAGEILVYTLDQNNYRCIVMGLFTHYFFLAQFTWMMTQAFNFWKILVMNDEHTDRKYVFYFLLGWGLPVVLVAAFYVITFNVYKYVYSMPYDFIYGDINNNGDMCFITNPYAALGGVILPVLLMLVAVAVVFVKAFQVTPQWQAYDDIYRGRYNISEIRTLLLFWAVIILTWLWGGLHLVYGQLWMLVMFTIFNIIQGLMAFILYSLLRNPYLSQCLSPQRATHGSYHMNGGHMFEPGMGAPAGGGPAPGSGQYQFHTNTLDVASLKGSRASLLNESWERESLPSRTTRTSRSTMKVKRTLPREGNLYIEPPVYHQNTISDTKDFDDLLYALKTGGSFSEVDSVNSEKGSDASSTMDKYELRRIDIADTHL